jgi:ribosomal protein L20A (L18A)
MASHGALSPYLCDPLQPQIFEKKPTTIKNFGIWVRYQSRTGYHNMYKEYRDVTLNGAVDQLYHEMGSRHRCRFSCIQIIKTATVPASACKRANIQQVCKRAGRRREIWLENGEAQRMHLNPAHGVVAAACTGYWQHEDLAAQGSTVPAGLKVLGGWAICLWWSPWDMCGGLAYPNRRMHRWAAWARAGRAHAPWLQSRDQHAFCSLLPWAPHKSSLHVSYSRPPSLLPLRGSPQFLDSKIKFPVTFKLVRPSSRTMKTTFKANRPNTAMY